MRHAIHSAPEELLMSYAAGCLCEGQSLVIASHLALCPEARETVADCEAIGGAFLEQAEPIALSDACLEKLMARLDGDHQTAGTAATSLAPESLDHRVPAPLRSYLPHGLDGISWRKVTGALEDCELQLGPKAARTKLLRIAPGAAMPRHAHQGEELTLVLTGGFTDDGKDYIRGDLSYGNGGLEHGPQAHPGEACICLTAATGPLRLTGPIGRFLNPFIRF